MARSGIASALYNFLRQWNTALFLLALLCSQPLFAMQQVTVAHHEEAPKLDGELSEWPLDRFTSVVVTNTRPDSTLEIPFVDVAMISVRDTVYAAFRWSDDSYDRQHKPYVWNNSKQRYEIGYQREDRLVVQFEMSGHYDVNWLSGNEFVADTWHWKSARTAPIGFAHDKTTRVVTRPILKAFRILNPQGTEIFIQRRGDAGDKIFNIKRYGLKESALMPRYIPNPAVTGSVADVKAAAKWKDGEWTLELMRKMDTGHDDDAQFTRGTNVRGGLAVFNRTGDDDHAISDNLMFVFE